MSAEILSYSRTQGVFAGINLSGGVLRADEETMFRGARQGRAQAIIVSVVKRPSAWKRCKR